MAGQQGQWPVRRHEQHRYLHVPHHWQSQSHDGICSCLNPNFLRLHDPKAHAMLEWSSRPHRKHRFPSVRLPGDRKLPRPRYRLWGFDFANISWYLFLPTQNQGLNLYMAGWFAFAGGTLFWFGAFFSVVEASNTGVHVNFPKELWRVTEHDVETATEAAKHLIPALPSEKQRAGEGIQDGTQRHATHSAHRIMDQPRSNGAQTAGSNGGAVQHALEVEDDSHPPKQPWRWWRWQWRDLGWCATFAQFIGATLFQVSVILGVPHVLPDLGPNTYPAWDATYWSLQVVGAWGFVFASIFFMLETQRKWYIPAPCNIGWQVGFWNLIGAIGFEVSPIFGYLAYPAQTAQKWGTSFSTYWGAWAFLIGSYLQLLEALNPHPVGLAEIIKGGFWHPISGDSTDDTEK